MLFLKLAWLNIRNHWKQTLVILFAIAASEFTLVCISSMMEGIRTNFYTNLVRESGHLQMHAQGWSDALDQTSLELVIPDAQGLLAKLSEDPNIVHAEGSLQIGALVVAENKNIGMLAVGTQENSFFYKRAREGIFAGSFLPQEKGVAISESTAALLGVKLGDTLTLLTEDVGGSPWYIVEEITGLFTTDSLDFDENILLIGMKTAERLSGLEQCVSEIRIDISDPEQAEHIQDTLLRELGNDYEIRTWREIHGSMLIFMSVFDYMIIGIDILLIIVAGTVITNSVLMSVFARTRELGTLRAIGLRKRGLFKLILTEGTLEGFFGSLIGLCIALPLVLSYREQGMTFGNLTDAFGLGNSIVFVLTPYNVVRDFTAGMLIALVGSSYAGLVISRESIMQTLKQS